MTNKEEEIWREPITRLMRETYLRETGKVGSDTAVYNYFEDRALVCDEDIEEYDKLGVSYDTN